MTNILLIVAFWTDTYTFARRDGCDTAELCRVRSCAVVNENEANIA